MSFRVVVDSCCDLTPSLLRDPVLISVPLSIQVEGITITDDAKFDQADLLARMKRSTQPPRTACPSPAQYIEAFGDGSDDIYVVTLSALLSGSHNSAVQARALFMEAHPDARVHVFNSCSASAGEVLIALKVKSLAESALPFSAVVETTSQYIREMNTLFVLEDLDNLKKNGRLSLLQSLVTGALKIKLLMGSTPEGQICKRGQALSMKQALLKMASLMASDPRHRDRTLCISHCNCLERAFELKERVYQLCHFRDIMICETGGISTFYANDGGVIAAY